MDVEGEPAPATGGPARSGRVRPGLFAAMVYALGWGVAAAHAAPRRRSHGDTGCQPSTRPGGAGRPRCHALEAVEGDGGGSGPAAVAVPSAGAAETPECRIPLASEGCYGLRPQDLHDAYELPATPVSPQTIAIVTAGGDPTIRKDLANYDREFGLEACPGESSCPQIVNGEGRPHPLPPVEGEAPLESSLDVEVGHAVCPGCALLLVEARSASLPAFEEATDTAARLGAGEISISWGEGEPAQAPGGGAAFDHPGIVITASAGDTGYLQLGLSRTRTRAAGISRVLPGRDRGRRHHARTRRGRRMAGRARLGSARTERRRRRQRLQHVVRRALMAAGTASPGTPSAAVGSEPSPTSRRSRGPTPGWPCTTDQGQRRGEAGVAATLGDERRRATGRGGLRARRWRTRRRLPGADVVCRRVPRYGAAARRDDRHERRMCPPARPWLHPRRTGGRLRGAGDLRRRPRLRRAHRSRDASWDRGPGAAAGVPHASTLARAAGGRPRRKPSRKPRARWRRWPPRRRRCARRRAVRCRCSRRGPARSWQRSPATWKRS